MIRTAPGRKFPQFSASAFSEETSNTCRATDRRIGSLRKAALSFRITLRATKSSSKHDTPRRPFCVMVLAGTRPVRRQVTRSLRPCAAGFPWRVQAELPESRKVVGGLTRLTVERTSKRGHFTTHVCRSVLETIRMQGLIIKSGRHLETQRCRCASSYCKEATKHATLRPRRESAARIRPG